MGGLGNQLFQLAFGLAATSDGYLEVVSAFGAPRLSKTGCPEIFDFKLPNNVILRDQSSNRLISKLINFQIKSSIRLDETSLPPVNWLKPKVPVDIPFINAPEVTFAKRVLP